MLTLTRRLPNGKWETMEYGQKEARADARRVLKLLPPGWKICTWEHCGQWYSCLTNKGLTLYIDGTGNDMRFWCLLSINRRHPHAGELYWTTSKIVYHKDPIAAIKDQLTLAKAHKRKVDMIVADLENLIR